MNSSQDYDLDDEQKAAVGALEPAIAVLAGPGSGKTRTLAYRARHLLSLSSADAALLLTFTNKAAAEMKSRALATTAVASHRLQASTFHTFCADVLRAHGELVGIAKDFEILDGADAGNFATTHSIPKSSRDRISSARVRRSSLPSDLADVAAQYEAAKRTENVVDFDDLVVCASHILETHTDIAKAFAGRFPHLLVDEFQDTNAVQAALVHSLSAYSKTVSIFADDDQAIFGFAGAEAENIRRFIGRARARVYALTWNYRSCSAIVDVANALVAGAPDASGRRMRPVRQGGQVELRSFAGTESEANSIADEVNNLVTAGASPASIAILVRAGRRVEDIVRALTLRGVPVTDWRGDTHTPEGRRLLAACMATVRATLNARQTQVLCNLMEVESDGKADTDVFLMRYSHMPLAAGLIKMRDMVFSGASSYELAQAAQQAVASQRDAFGRVLNDILKSIGSFQEHDPEFSLEHLLAELALGSLGRAPAVGGGVKVASLHRTKGLQWETVYLVGLEEGHMPDSRSNTPSELAEERRLCFVGVSRAQHRLVVTHSEVVRGYASTRSRYVREMGM